MNTEELLREQLLRAANLKLNLKANLGFAWENHQMIFNFSHTLCHREDLARCRDILANNLAVMEKLTDAFQVLEEVLVEVQTIPSLLELTMHKVHTVHTVHKVHTVHTINTNTPHLLEKLPLMLKQQVVFFHLSLGLTLTNFLCRMK